MVLVERDDEFELLQGTFETAAAGSGQLVVANGPVGCGKTTLLHTFAGRATASGAIFLCAGGARDERDQPLGVVQQLLDHAAAIEAAHESRGADIDHGADGGSAALAGAPAPGSSEETDHGAVVETRTAQLLVRTVRRLARRSPVLIGVDDADDADTSSLRCLLYLIRRISPERVMIVVNESADSEPRRWDFHAELLRQSHCRSLRLGLLSPRGVGTLLTRNFGVSASEALSQLCHVITGGNPKLLQGAIDDCRAADGLPDFEIGEGFRRALLGCLYRWEPAMHQVALALAVLGSQAGPSAIGRLLGMQPQSVARGITTLTAAGLLENNDFRHPAARSAILGDVQVGDHDELHQRASALLADELEAAEMIGPSVAGCAEVSALRDVRRPSAEQMGGALSDAEIRVARLAAAGHTNRQIARQLFVTVSTVEQHLTRVYRKLKVNHRADLPEDLAVTA